MLSEYSFAQDTRSSEFDTLRAEMSYLKDKNSPEYIKSKQKLDRMVSQHKIPYTKDDRFKDAIRLIQEQKFNAAIYELNSLIDENYNKSRCYELLGDICYNSKKPARKIVQYYKNALQYDPNNTSVLLKLSKIYLAENKNIMGMEYLSALIDSTDDYSILSKVETLILNSATPVNKYEVNNFYETLGNVQIKLGKREDSYRNFSKALQANPNDIYLKYYLVNLLYDDNCPEDVVKVINAIQPEKPVDTQLRNTKAKALAMVGDVNSAYKEYVDILRQNPASKQAKYGIYKLLENRLSPTQILAKINFDNLSYVATKEECIKFAKFLDEFDDVTGSKKYRNLAYQMQEEERRQIEYRQEQERIRQQELALAQQRQREEAERKRQLELQKQKELELKKQREYELQQEKIRKQKEEQAAKLKAQKEAQEAKLKAQQEALRKQKEAQIAKQKAQQEALRKQKEAQEAKLKAQKEAQIAKQKAQQEALRKQKEAQEAKLKAQKEAAEKKKQLAIQKQKELKEQAEKQAQIKAEQERIRQEKLKEQREKQLEAERIRQEELRIQRQEEEERLAKIKAEQEKAKKEKEQKEYTQRKASQELKAFQAKNPTKYSEYSKAITNYLKTEPKDSALYQAVGNAYRLMECPTSAIKYYKEAIKLSPADSDLYYNSALSYMELNSFETAYNNLDKAIKLEPSNTKAKNLMPFVRQKLVTRYINDAYSKFEAKNYINASTILDEGIKKIPDSAQLYYYRALSYDAMNRNAAAIIDLQKVVNLDPSLYMAFYQLGKSYEKIKDERNALVAYERFLSIEPDEKELIDEIQKKVVVLGQKYY